MCLFGWFVAVESQQFSSLPTTPSPPVKGEPNGGKGWSPSVDDSKGELKMKHLNLLQNIDETSNFVASKSNGII